MRHSSKNNVSNVLLTGNVPQGNRMVCNSVEYCQHKREGEIEKRTTMTAPIGWKHGEQRRHAADYDHDETNPEEIMRERGHTPNESKMSDGH